MASIIQHYSKIFRIPITECYKNNVYSIQIGIYKDELQIICNNDLKNIKQQAYKEFFNKHGQSIADELKKYKNDAYDYIKYSQDTILQNCTIHKNDESFLEFVKTYKGILSFDSEGNNPVTLAQFCGDSGNVYLFELPKYIDAVREILGNNSIKKIVCDLNAEQKAFNIVIGNVYDIQCNENKSLVTCIAHEFDINLRKCKGLHIRGWHHPLPCKHIDYAAADVLWQLQLYLKMLNNNNR
jgi:hypothetical protein